jgi:predicted transcriptional regulator
VSAQPASNVSAELEAVLAAARSKEAAAPRQAIAKVAYNHVAMIDLILMNPGLSQNQLAAHFGLTASWVSQVLVSDAFQTAMAKRRAELIDPLVQATVEENFKALVARSLDVLQQKLNRPALEIPDNLALRALEIGSRAAGYGAKDPSLQQAATPAEVHIHLEQLGGGLVQLLQRKKLEAQVIDGEATAVKSQLAQLTNDTSEEP